MHTQTQDHYNLVHHVPVEAGGRGKAGEIHFMDDGAEFAKMVERERQPETAREGERESKREIDRERQRKRERERERKRGLEMAGRGGRDGEIEAERRQREIER